MKVVLPSALPQQQKSSAAQIAGDRVHNRQREACRHGRVYRIAALAQHFEACVRGKVVHAHHHPVPGGHRFLAHVGQRLHLLLRGQAGRQCKGA